MRQRIISAIIALMIFIPLLILGGIFFKIGLSFIGVLAIKEILNLKKDIPKMIEIISYIVTFLLIILDINLLVKILIILFIYLLLLIFFEEKKYNIEDAFSLIVFNLLIVLFFSYMYLIRESDINTLIYLFLITILTDTFAYIGGKIFGKHKLIERISPNKTVEGLISGLIFGTIISSIYYIYTISFGNNNFYVFILSIILGISSSIGDLVFSCIKRYFNEKDFSNLIKGHGGLNDRLDSLIFVIISYIIMVWR